MRIVTHERTGPYKMKVRNLPGAEKLDPDSKVLELPIEFCGCGLSHDKPFCDGSHRITKDEDPSQIYVYSESKERVISGKFYKPESKV
jgi:CDGSH-type Zn-finger protein